MKRRKFLVVVPCEAGYFVCGAYGSALLDMAQAAHAAHPGSVIRDCVTAAGAGETLKRLPPVFVAPELSK